MVKVVTPRVEVGSAGERFIAEENLSYVTVCGADPCRNEKSALHTLGVIMHIAIQQVSYSINDN